jgi:hypothetical protein
MIKKILHCAGWIAIFGNLLLIGLVAFWLIAPYKVPVVEEPIPIENINKTIAIGEPIEMLLKVEKHKELSPIVQHNITCTDGNLVAMASSPKVIPTGKYTIHSKNFILPPKVAKGATCQFNFINTYKLNPLRSQTEMWSSEQFKVKE